MTLHLDGRRIECLGWRVDAPEGGRVVWRFVTPDSRVFRVCHAPFFPMARTPNLDADEVRVVSLFWPVQELCAAIARASTDKERRELAGGFLVNLVRQFDPAYPGAYPGTLISMAKVQGARPGPSVTDPVGFSRGKNAAVKTIPDAWVTDFCGRAAKLGPTPSHGACAALIREIGNELEEVGAIKHGAGGLTLVVKRLALKYDTLTPEPTRRSATPRFAPYHADNAEDFFFYKCRRRVADDERADAETPDGYAFQCFLESIEYVSLHHWPDIPPVLPVEWADTEPQKANAVDRELAGGREVEGGKLECGCLTIFDSFRQVMCDKKHYDLTDSKQARILLQFLCDMKALNQDTAREKCEILKALKAAGGTVANDWRPAHVFRGKLSSLYTGAIGRNKTKGLYWIKS